MLILGVDCGHKSLGFCVVKHNKTWRAEHTDVYEKFIAKKLTVRETFEQFNKIYDSVFDIQYMKIFDLIPGIKLENSTMEQRAGGLKKVLKKFDKEYSNLDMVLIEYQLSANFKTNELFNHIYFHYYGKYDVYSVGPSLKNTLEFSDGCQYSIFAEKYAKPYDANKNHAKANLKFWLKLFKKEHFLDGIKKTNYDDAADSFLTIVGFFVTQPGF